MLSAAQNSDKLSKINLFLNCPMPVQQVNNSRLAEN